MGQNKIALCVQKSGGGGFFALFLKEANLSKYNFFSKNCYY